MFWGTPAPIRRFNRLFKMDEDESVIGYEWAYVGSYVRGIVSRILGGDPDNLIESESERRYLDKSGHIVVTTKHAAFVSSLLSGRGLIFFPIADIEKIEMGGGPFVHELTCWVWKREITRWWYPKGAYSPHCQTFRLWSRRARDRVVAEIERAKGLPLSLRDQRADADD